MANGHGGVRIGAHPFNAMFVSRQVSVSMKFPYRHSPDEFAAFFP